VVLQLEADAPTPVPPFEVCWKHPSADIHATWEPTAGANRGLRVDWGRPTSSRVTSGAPVVCLHSASGTNQLTFACSEVLELVQVKAAVHEETGEFHCSLGLCQQGNPSVTSYKVAVRIDTRNVPYFEALQGVSDWWAAMPGCTPAFVPEIARMPMYSTWYSFHQHLSAGAIEAECRRAKELGCEAVIVDDGWQTLDGTRGYAFCGDWDPDRLPEMREHVARVHAIGMKYLLWYSVPFIGAKSTAFARFKGRYLEFIPRHNAAVLDPRYPEVREYLITTYETAMQAWDLDGFKLDFVDSFSSIETELQHAPEERDCATVEEGAGRLLGDVMKRLRKIKPEVMIEFRQSSIGPMMRKNGNIFRVGDCPNDGIRNRTGTIDLRLLSGTTAVHSDMLMWHGEDPVESAALQLLNVLFAVPQISVMLGKLPREHTEMVRFWLAFWRTHREVLLDGELMPRHPELFYPTVIASTPSKRIAVAYSDFIVNVGGGIPRELFVINGTRGDRVVIEVTADEGDFEVTIFDCCGAELQRSRLHLHSGLHSLAIPPAGLASFRR